jgi:hypothetical protein
MHWVTHPGFTALIPLLCFVLGLGRDSKVYSISLSQCGMVKRFLQEPAMQFDFNPSELTADHIAKKLLDEDMY